MENSINSTSLAEIVYPVFKLGLEKPIVQNKLVFYWYENLVENDEHELEQVNVYRIVDDKNIDLPSLALRRLAIKAQGVKLFKINKAIFFLGDLIKISKPNMWFIDSKGKLFTYHKQTRALLKFYKIKYNIPLKAGGSIIEAEGVPSRFKSLFSPEQDKKYVGILHIGISQILYGFYAEKPKDTWRMV